jgi:hypothetical protein
MTGKMRTSELQDQCEILIAFLTMLGNDAHYIPAKIIN